MYNIGDELKCINKDIYKGHHYFDELKLNHTYIIDSIEDNIVWPYQLKLSGTDDIEFCFDQRELIKCFKHISICKCGSYKRIGEKHHSWCLEYR